MNRIQIRISAIGILPQLRIFFPSVCWPRLYCLLFLLMPWGMLLGVGDKAAAEPTGWRAVPERPPISQLQESYLPPVTIQAIRFQIRDMPRRGSLQLREGERLDVSLRLHCRSAHWPTPPEILLQFEGEGPTIREAAELPGDLCDAVGAETLWHGGITPPRFMLNGNVTLSVYVRHPDSTAGEEPPRDNLLYRIPAHIYPAVVDSDIDLAKLHAVFGDDAQALRTRFRLGQSTQVRLSVPSNLPFTPRRLGIVSRIEYTAAHRQGEVVCMISLRTRDITPSTLMLHNGVHTGFGNRNYYVPDTTPTEKPPVFKRLPASDKNQAGEPYDTLLYWTVLDLPIENPEDLYRLEFQSLKPDGLLEVRDVLLLP